MVSEAATPQKLALRLCAADTAATLSGALSQSIESAANATVMVKVVDEKKKEGKIVGII